MAIPATLVLTLLWNLSLAGQRWGVSRFFVGSGGIATSSERVNPYSRDNFVYKYEDLVRRALAEPFPAYPRIPCVCPGWDNSPRRKTGAVIFFNSTPELYEGWLREIVKRQASRISVDGNCGISPGALVFINAWNEWAEGNHLEPCQKWGRAYLEATRRVLRVIANQDTVSAATRV